MKYNLNFLLLFLSDYEENLYFLNIYYLLSTFFVFLKPKRKQTNLLLLLKSKFVCKTDSFFLPLANKKYYCFFNGMLSLMPLATL